MLTRTAQRLLRHKTQKNDLTKDTHLNSNSANSLSKIISPSLIWKEHWEAVNTRTKLSTWKFCSCSRPFQLNNLPISASISFSHHFSPSGFQTNPLYPFFIPTVTSRSRMRPFVWRFTESSAIYSRPVIGVNDHAREISPCLCRNCGSSNTDLWGDSWGNPDVS